MEGGRSQGRSWIGVLREAVQEFGADDMGTYASALAFQVLLALFPFLIFLIALLGFLDIPQFFDWLREQAAFLLPASTNQQLNTVLGELQQPRGGLLSFGIIGALWAASGGIRALINALNVAYDVPEGRPAWKLFGLSVLYTIALAVMLISSAALMILGPQLAGWIARQIGLEQIFVLAWSVARWPVIVLLLMVAVAIIYYVGPNVRQPFRLITPGSVLAVIVWIAASLAFGFYASNFANYSATYGSIGAIVALLFYFFLTSNVLLFGAEVNSVLLKRAGGASTDTAPAPEADGRPLRAPGERVVGK